MLSNDLKQLIKKFSLQIDELFKLQIGEKTGVYQGEVLNKEKIKPYHVTVVRDGEQIEIPYSEFYKDAIKDILSTVKEIQKHILEKKAFGRFSDWWSDYFEAIYSGFKENKWEKVEEKFLTQPEDNEYLLSVGPIERYHDTEFGVKKYFSFWFLERDSSYAKYEKIWRYLQTQDLDDLFSIYLNPKKPKRLLLFLGRSLYQSGEVFALRATGWSRPEDPKIAERYGSIKLIAVDKLEEKIKSITKEALSEAKRKKINSKILALLESYNNNYPLLSTILHEYAHTVYKSPTAIKRLGKDYAFIEEARAEAIQLYLHLYLEKKGKIDKNSLLAIILFYVLGFKSQKKAVEEIPERYTYFYFTVMLVYQLIKNKILKVNKNLKINIEEFKEKIQFILMKLVYIYLGLSWFAEENSNELRKFKEFLAKEVNELGNKLR